MLQRPSLLFTCCRDISRVYQSRVSQHYRSFSTKQNTQYDGTPSSYANNSSSYLGDALLTDGSIETVELAYDKHSPKDKPSVFKSPLIILHGLFGSKTNNRTISKQLATRLDRDVYCLDLRNFGSSPHVDRLDYPSLSADVEKFIEDAEFPENAKPIIIGHSMGAKTVMALALRKPDVPKMVVSVDNAPLDLTINSVSSFSKYIRQLRISLEQYKYTNIKDVDAELAKVEKSKEIRQFLLTNLNRGKNDEIITSKVPLDVISKAVTGGNVSGWPYDLNISRWSKGPVLIVRGTESSYVPDDCIPDIGKYFPVFDVRDIESGHWVISEKPQEFMDTLIEFIERNEDEEN